MMKRIAAILLTMAVALCAALPVFAAGTIEVTEDVSVSDDYDWTRFKGQNVTLNVYNWWSFLAWFDAIGEGSFATVVAIRDKLRRGKRLENWELDYYRTHRAVVELRGVESAEEQAEKRRLLALLGG